MVRMTGSRYVLSGYDLPHLVPFIEHMTGLPFDPRARVPEIPAVVPASNLSPALRAALEAIVTPARCCTDAGVRLAHSHGQLSVREIDRAIYGGGLPRVVDVVVEPESEADVQADPEETHRSLMPIIRPSPST